MNTGTKLLSLMIATLVSGLLMSGAVSAMPIASQCSVDPDGKKFMTLSTDNKATCLASGGGNIQDGAAGGDQFLTGVGAADNFQKIKLFEDGGLSDFTNDDETWSFSSGIWDDFDRIALGFKFGGNASEPDQWFVYELFGGDFSGTYDYSSQQALSHAIVYGTNSVSVPEPGTLALLGLGIVGLTLSRRRTHTN